MKHATRPSVFACFILLFILLSFEAPVSLQWTSPASVMGGGNFDNGDLASTGFQFPILTTYYGAGMLRCNLYSGNYFNDNTFTVVLNIDDFMNATHAYGVTPMILFEFYQNINTNPIGNYTKWYNIGRGFAQRYAPNGSYWTSVGISGFGVSAYTAFNEPEGTGLDTTLYHNALEGLADGVHSVSSSLKVNPGGFKNANAASDFTLGGYGTAVADLWNNGKLDGVDLHTYYDYVYAPIEGSYSFSANSNFRSVKITCGITADINFYTTEFNYKAYNGAWSTGVQALVTQTFAAQGYLTGIWDNLGTVKTDKKTSATQFAFTWNLFNTEASDPSYGLAVAEGPPFSPTPRASVLQLVGKLTQGMSFNSLDPWDTGVYLLSRQSDGAKLWVFQNRAKWSSIAGTSFLVEGIPSYSTNLTVWAYDGMRAAYSLNGTATSYNVTGLTTGETYMFAVNGNPSASSSASTTSDATRNCQQAAFVAWVKLF